MAQGINYTTKTPNYLGMLFNTNIRKTQFLSLIGGTDGANALITDNITFPVSVAYAIDNPAQPKITEEASVGAGKPTYFGLTQETNNVQIFQEDVTVSKLRQMNRGALSGVNTAGAQPEENDELARQVILHLEKIKRDMNFTAINGKHADGGITNEKEAIGTRGISEAIKTNVIKGKLTADKIAELIRKVWDKGAFDTPVIFVNSKNRQAISKAYKMESLTEVERDRFVAGVAVNRIVTEFGDVYVVTDNDVVDTELLLVDIAYVRPVFMRDPETNEIITVKPLSQRGGTTLEMYATFGLDHNNEQLHGKLTIEAETPGV